MTPEQIAAKMAAMRAARKAFDPVVSAERKRQKREDLKLAAKVRQAQRALSEPADGVVDPETAKKALRVLGPNEELNYWKAQYRKVVKQLQGYRRADTTKAAKKRGELSMMILTERILATHAMLAPGEIYQRRIEIRQDLLMAHRLFGWTPPAPLVFPTMPKVDGRRKIASQPPAPPAPRGPDVQALLRAASENASVGAREAGA